MKKITFLFIFFFIVLSIFGQSRKKTHFNYGDISTSVSTFGRDNMPIIKVCYDKDFIINTDNGLAISIESGAGMQHKFAINGGVGLSLVEKTNDRLQRCKSSMGAKIILGISCNNGMSIPYFTINANLLERFKEFGAIGINVGGGVNNPMFKNTYSFNPEMHGGLTSFINLGSNFSMFGNVGIFLNPRGIKQESKFIGTYEEYASSKDPAFQVDIYAQIGLKYKICNQKKKVKYCNAGGGEYLNVRFL